LINYFRETTTQSHMVFDLNSFRQLEANINYIELNPAFTDKDYQFCGYLMLPMGIFLVLQGYPRRKIANFLICFFLSFCIFGGDIVSGKDLATQGEGALKLIALGGALAAASYKAEFIGYAIIGLFGAFLTNLTLLYQTNEVTSSQQLNDLFQRNIQFNSIAVIAGFFVPMCFKERILLPLSLLCGATMIIKSMALMDQGKKFYNPLYQKREQFFMIEGIAIVVGFLVQYLFKKREERLNEEIKKQKEEDNEKKYGATNAYYKKMNAAAAQPQPVNLGAVPQPVYMNMMYSPLLPQPVYQQPVIPTLPRHQSTVSLPVPRHQTTATVPPPKEEHKSIAEIQANLTQINVESKKNQYEF